MPILFVTGIIVNLQMFGNEITHICSMKFYFLMEVNNIGFIASSQLITSIH